MVKHGNKVVAEQNDPDTVTLSGTEELRSQGLVCGNGDQEVREINLRETGMIFHTNAEGKTASFDLVPNKRLCTDANGNLVWR